MSTLEGVRRLAAANPTRPAVSSATESLSYRELLTRATVVARELGHGAV